MTAVKAEAMLEMTIFIKSVVLVLLAMDSL